MIDLTKFIDVDEDVEIRFPDETSLTCRIDSVDDEEESGLGEIGISVSTPDGRYMEIGASEIESIEILKTNHGKKRIVRNHSPFLNDLSKMVYHSTDLDVIDRIEWIEKHINERMLGGKMTVGEYMELEQLLEGLI